MTVGAEVGPPDGCLRLRVRWCDVTPTRRSRPEKNPGAATSTSLDASDSTRHGDNDADIALVGGVNADLWAALFAGQFRLAVKCDRCGRWLTAGPSKRAGIGAHCAAQVVNK